ncbi:acyl-CoA dehydrogenase family protein [Actinophytocola oryzae]|uniref:Alkylation response protein AidB-like acyl-CoA dehydrogenase n=1 Tax=Actinophytocola oryzae TaxID=502181 RepID=A0A4R7VKX5_9PSEU|nr:acyl-CoA dehydrogenase family protein [Actinophytocola oryzae]TDV49829.1 alkylation response protein AidB-like acyl-CoA dehydrogenase [Actinophytocola oryzae]
MIFEFDADQRLLRDTVREVLDKECSAAFVRAVVDDGADPDPLWHTCVDLGWTELTGADEVVELAVVLEELGRHTDPTPYLATMTQFAPLAPGAAKPDRTGAAVFDGVSARADGSAWVLDGTASHVLDGDRAEWLAVVTGAGVFTVPATAAHVTRASVFDPLLHVAEVAFRGVRVSTDDLVEVDAGRARQVAVTGLAITMVGACRRILDLVLAHVRDRHQFGAPVGSFQAVQHKAADMHVAIERARALAYFAALTLAADDPRRTLAASMAKAAAGECQSLVFRHGYQLFGAMGYTWENDVQFALKRAKAGELMLGGAAEHRALVAQGASCG